MFLHHQEHNRSLRTITIKIFLLIIKMISRGIFCYVQILPSVPAIEAAFCYLPFFLFCFDPLYVPGA